jgi:TatD DNase family protein
MTEALQWIDTHCHVYEENIPGGQEHALQAARDAGVVTMIVIGTDADTTRQAIEIASVHPDVFATVGLHPHDAKNGIETIVPYLQSAKVVGIGECGLDYYYDHSDRAVQRDVFAQQIQLAHQLDLPLVIHTREAWDDTFDVLDAQGTPAKTIFHCFTGGEPEARACVERGAYLSFSGIVTFKTANDVREAAQWCPPEHMLIETDAPFLAPVPHRGRPNQVSTGIVPDEIVYGYCECWSFAYEKIRGNPWKRQELFSAIIFSITFSCCLSSLRVQAFFP